MEREKVLHELLLCFKEMALSLKEELDEMRASISRQEELCASLTRRIDQLEERLSSSPAPSLSADGAGASSRGALALRGDGLLSKVLTFLGLKRKPRRVDPYMQSYVDFLKKNPEKIFLVPAQRLERRH